MVAEIARDLFPLTRSTAESGESRVPVERKSPNDPFVVVEVSAGDLWDRGDLVRLIDVVGDTSASARQSFDLALASAPQEMERQTLSRQRSTKGPPATYVLEVKYQVAPR